MARKSHRKNRRAGRRLARTDRYQWVAVLIARTAAAVLLMIVARLLGAPACGGG